MPLVYLVAGEASGDVLGARLMMALRKQRPDIDFAGVGGQRMQHLGLSSLFPMHELAVMGLLEILPRVNRIRLRLQETAADIAARHPDVVVTIDSPGFTLRLLKSLRPLGIPRVHYVAPQVWAWRENRVRHFPGLWEKLLCLLPFEPAFFARHGIPAKFVGHPVLESGANQGDGLRFRIQHGLQRNRRIVVLMPGSRRNEAPRLLPVFGRTIEMLASRVPDLVPVIPTPATVLATIRRSVASWPITPILVTDLQGKHDAYAAADVALTKSGTSTLELALADVPMAVTYRVNPITGAMAKRLIRVPHVAMINLLAGRDIVPELLQDACNPVQLSAALLRLIIDEDARATQLDAFSSIMGQLRPAHGTPSGVAANEILRVFEKA